MSGLDVDNFGEMKAKVLDWADRSDISSDIVEDFINIAVQRTNRKALVPFIESVADITIVNGSVPLPTNYLEARQLTVTTGGSVCSLERKYVQMVEDYASRSSGVPVYFARKEQNLLLAPAPSGITEATLYFYTEVDTMTADTDTNWYIEEATTAILYAALKELFVYVSDEDTASTYEGQWLSAVNEINETYDKAEWSGDTLALTL